MIDQYIEIGYQIIVALSLICTGATVLAKLTPTDKDDKFIGKISKYLKAIADLKKPQNQFCPWAGIRTSVLAGRDVGEGYPAFSGDCSTLCEQIPNRFGQ